MSEQVSARMALARCIQAIFKSNDSYATADLIIRVFDEYGFVIVPKEPTSSMTIVAEQMGAGEAWAEDCWAAMIDAWAKESSR